MNAYVQFNLVLCVAVLLSSPALITTKAQLILVLRVTAFVTLLAFPWDFLAISFSAWDYADPGPRLFRVPYNDILFISLCTILSASVLTRYCPVNRFDPQSQAKTEDDA